MYGGYYLFSYSMNYYFEDSPYPYPDNTYKAPRISGVQNSSEKIVLVEEDPLTISDGCWLPPALNPDDPNDPETKLSDQDLLCVRHDREKAQPDTIAPYTSATFPNPGLRGNVNFADGHAEFVTRLYAHDPRHLDPLR